MEIKARAFGLLEVTIIDFVSAHNSDIKAIYVDAEGKVDSCFINRIEILDKDYIPSKN